ncbi:hypothetical protein GCM10020295_05130 [Streptomyces cinereospinus]
MPVVPEENSTHSGASKGTCAKSQSAGSATASAQRTVVPSVAAGSPRFGIWTVTRTDGSAARSAAVSARRSCCRPFHR